MIAHTNKAGKWRPQFIYKAYVLEPTEIKLFPEGAISTPAWLSDAPLSPVSGRISNLSLRKTTHRPQGRRNSHSGFCRMILHKSRGVLCGLGISPVYTC
jgi:hypothetical protein